MPAFIGFVAAGVPIGVTMSFLIASPLVNEIAIGLLLGMFGIGPTFALRGRRADHRDRRGLDPGRFHAERWVEPFVFETRLRGQVIDSTTGLTWGDRIAMGRDEVVTILRKIWPYLLVGIGVGAIIHGWVPTDFFHHLRQRRVIRWASSSRSAWESPVLERGRRHATGSILYGAGLPMGTLLAFMMSVVALSLPEMILLRRVLKPQLIGAFIAVVATGIVIVGYSFNLLLA